MLLNPEQVRAGDLWNVRIESPGKGELNMVKQNAKGQDTRQIPYFVVSQWKNNEKPQKSTKNTNQINKNSVELCWHRIANDV